MDQNNIICPVCTLYLRPGITLKAHLASHPKQKIIEALVSLSHSEDVHKGENIQVVPGTSSGGNSQNNIVASNATNGENIGDVSPNSGVHGNHLFIYQQSMSTTGSQQNVLNVNPLAQQYVIPAVFNSQMMPYVYQQQQVIMSSGGCVPPPIRALSFDLTSASDTNASVNDQTCTITEEAHESDVVSSDSNPHICEVLNSEENNKPLAETIIGKDEKIIVHKEELNEPDVLNAEVDTSYQHNEEEYNEDDCMSSPHSQGSEWSLKIRTDLNKACQTHNTSNLSPRSFIQEDDAALDNIETVEPEYYFPSESEVPTTNTVNVSMQGYGQPDTVYSASNILQSNENIDFVEMDGMQVIINGFTTNHIISQVENFDNSKPERPGVLMTIGGMVDISKDIMNEHREDSFSHDGASVDIRADEHMPSRGELSGQESKRRSWNILE